MESLTSVGRTSCRSPLAQPPSSDSVARANSRRRQWHACIGGGGDMVIGCEWLRPASAPNATTTAAAGLVAGIRLKTVIRSALDTDHRQDDDGRRFGAAVDVFTAAAAAGLVRKLDHFAHCEPPSVPAQACRIGACPQLKGAQG